MRVECPMPALEREVVQMAHGGGGRMMNELLQKAVLPLLGEMPEGGRHDAATVGLPGARLAFTTDSYVVSPLFFPGGDIGSLAVNGTINDLAMAGAQPLVLSCALILEEGFPLRELERVLRSLRSAADAAGVRIVTGDTKVVDRGKGDGVFINTAGIGLLADGVTIRPDRIREGDAILVNGDLGRHGIAVMAAREGLALEHAIESDSAPLHGEVAALLEAGVTPHCLRDLTRGGLASAVVELAEAARLAFRLEEAALAVRDDVRGACEVLGLDPLYLANEGRFVAFVAPEDVAAALRALPRAYRAGSVRAEPAGGVSVVNAFGSERVLPMLSGEQLPRIC